MATATLPLSAYFRTTVGKKKIIGITGLGMSAFLVSHMAGNLLILAGPELYNKYSHALISNPFLPVAEWGLVLFFVLHLCLAAQLTFFNRTARGDVRYDAGTHGVKKTSFAAKSMILSGLVLGVFTVLHLLTFKYGAHYTATYDGVEMRDLHRLVIEKFQEPGYVAWYVFALGVMGLHLSHGLSSACQSLGITASNRPCLYRAGWVTAVLLALGFIVQPLYVFFFYGAA